MAISAVQTGCTVLRQSFAVLFQFPWLYLSSVLFSPSFSPTSREIKLRKHRNPKSPNPSNFDEIFQYLFPSYTEVESWNTSSPSPHGRKEVVKTLCSEWMKHSIGINFSVELCPGETIAQLPSENCILSIQVRYQKACGLEVWGLSIHLLRHTPWVISSHEGKKQCPVKEKSC